MFIFLSINYKMMIEHNCLYISIVGGNAHIIIIYPISRSMSEAIPKYMLLDETSEEIRDRRIMPLTDYKE